MNLHVLSIWFQVAFRYGPWACVEEMSNGSYLTFLSNELDDVIMNVGIEKDTKRHLGETVFGDRDQQTKNLDEIQIEKGSCIRAEGAKNQYYQFKLKSV